MQLDFWANRWNISQAAINELRMLFGIAHNGLASKNVPLSEGAILNLVRIEASRLGCRLWRNNVGAVYTVDGTFLRYGLANESKGVNKEIKSSDLVGIRPVKIVPKMLGATIGQFMCREIKKSDWEYRGTAREQAQLRWLELISSFGGDAQFTTGEGSI